MSHDVRTNNHSGLWENWVIDVTKWPEFCFYPKEEDGSIVKAMTYVGEKCPGKLVEAIHDKGQKEADKWRRLNPGWHEKFRAIPPTDSDKDAWINDPRIKFSGAFDVKSESQEISLSIPDHILKEGDDE